MSKTNPPPKPLPAPPVPKTIMCGYRECDFTIATFNLHSSGNADDHLTMEIDDRRATSSVMVTIRGKWEAAEVPGHLRWFADAIAQHGENKRPAIREHVTYEKFRGGGA